MVVVVLVVVSGMKIRKACESSEVSMATCGVCVVGCWLLLLLLLFLLLVVVSKDED